MKNKLIYIFLLCSLFAQAQEVSKDSIAIEQVNGLYFSARYVEYDNGNAQTTRTIIGDGTAAAVFSQNLALLRIQSESMASQAEDVSKFPKRLTEIKRQSDAIKTLLNKSPLDTIQAAQIATYIAPGWTMKTNGVSTPVDVVFSVTAGGQMRHNLGNTPRNVTYFGDAMRLHNFPSSGINTDFFRVQNGNFVTLDRAYILRKPGSTQQRNAAKPATLKTRQ